MSEKKSRLEREIINTFLSVRFYGDCPDDSLLAVQKKIRKAGWCCLFVSIITIGLLVSGIIIKGFDESPYWIASCTFLVLSIFCFIIYIIALSGTEREFQALATNKIADLERELLKFKHRDIFLECLRDFVLDIQKNGGRNYHWSILNESNFLLTQLKDEEYSIKTRKETIDSLAQNYT